MNLGRKIVFTIKYFHTLYSSAHPNFNTPNAFFLSENHNGKSFYALNVNFVFLSIGQTVFSDTINDLFDAINLKSKETFDVFNPIPYLQNNGDPIIPVIFLSPLRS